MTRLVATALPLLPMFVSTLRAQDLRLLELPTLATIQHDPSRGHTLALSRGGTMHEFDGTNWRRLPVARATSGGSKMVYDALLDRMLCIEGDAGTRFVTSVFDGNTWTELAPQASPSPRWNFAACFDAMRGEVVLFGGTHATNLQDLGDTWIFDGQQWDQRQPTHAPQPSRNSACSFDLLRGVTVLYRAQDGATWEWDGIDWTLAMGSSPPGPRRVEAMAFDLLRQQTLLYGGLPTTQHDELWAWDGNTWIELIPTGVRPPLHNEPQLAFDTTLGEALLIDRDGRPDTWSWNGTRWLRQPAPWSHANQGEPLVFAAPDGSLHALQSWPAATRRWDGGAWLDVPGAQPSARSLAIAATGPAFAYVLGGVDASSTSFTDVWGFDGAQWSVLSTTAPANRIGQAVAYDWARNELVCFGGITPNSATVNAETWVFDGVTWHLRQPAVAPPARCNAVATFDPTRGAVVLQGGLGQNQFHTDTWLWDGHSWSQLTGALPEPTVPMMSMAFDATRNAAVLLTRAGPSGVMAWELTAQGWAPVTLGDIDPNWVGMGGGAQAIGFPQPNGLLVLGNQHLFRFDLGQATVTTRGTPCTPSAPTLAAARWARPGASDFAFDVLRGPSASFAALVVGLQPASLPIGSCTLLVQNGISLLVPTSAHGAARVAMPIPGSPAFLGLSCHAQAAALDAAAPAGFTLSAAVDFTIGS